MMSTQDLLNEVHSSLPSFTQNEPVRGDTLGWSNWSNGGHENV